MAGPRVWVSEPAHALPLVLLPPPSLPSSLSPDAFFVVSLLLS